MLPVLQQAYASWSLIRGSQASLKDAIDLLDQPLPEHATNTDITPIKFDDNISLNDLSFSYDDNLILKGLNLKISKGSRIGIRWIYRQRKKHTLGHFNGFIITIRRRILY